MVSREREERERDTYIHTHTHVETNQVLDGAWDAKLIDFGAAEEGANHRRLTTLQGTPG